MDNDTLTDNIYVGTGANFPEICRQCKTTRSIFSDSDIADVSKMELTFSPFSVRNIRRIPVTASGCTVGCTAITVFMDMNGMKTGRCAPESQP